MNSLPEEDLVLGFGLSLGTVTAIPGRMFATHYIVSDPSSSSRFGWFLKCHPRDVGLRHLDLLFALHGHLRERGLAVPAMRSATDGASGLHHKGRLYSCFSWFPHATTASPDRHSWPAGALLGHLHRA